MLSFRSYVRGSPKSAADDARTRRRRIARWRPTITPLEDRTLLSTFVVNHAGNRPDVSAGNGVCETAISGECSLRAAIQEANAYSGPDVITFDCDYLTGLDCPATIGLTSALPDIAEDLTITGPGHIALGVQRSSGGAYRIFKVLSDVDVEISGLSIRYGQAAIGGGIYNAGNLEIFECVIAHNEATSSSETDLKGGAIYNASGASLEIGGTTISRNSVHYPETPPSLVGPTANYYGGGIYNEGTLDVRFSYIYENEIAASDHGNNVSARGEGGGILNYLGTMTIVSSLISENSITVTGDFNGSEDAIGRGGGIASYGDESYDELGNATIDNSTIAENLVDNPATGDDVIAAVGGGMFNQWGTFLVRWNTIADNTALADYATSTGGGIHIFDASSIVTLFDTIVAENTADDGTNVYGTIDSDGHNLFSDNDIDGEVGSDLLNADANLGPLQDNGGLTYTMELLEGSDAIDAGDNTGAPPFDQRGPGFDRTVNDIDIGAFEVQEAELPGFGGHRPNLGVPSLASAQKHDRRTSMSSVVRHAAVGLSEDAGVRAAPPFLSGEDSMPLDSATASRIPSHRPMIAHDSQLLFAPFWETAATDLV